MIMIATIVDLRYKMKEILKAIDRNEKVTVLYHGREKCVIIPKHNAQLKKTHEHPFFGMNSDDVESVHDIMLRLRGALHRDI